MDEIEFFAPWRLVAAFADGSRLLFDGLTEEQARYAMEAAQEEHGDIGYWNRVTDQNYEDGRYYKTVPPPPCPTTPKRLSRPKTPRRNPMRPSPADFIPRRMS